MDMSCNNMSFYIPSFGIYHIVNTLCNRQVVRGRATRVYSVKRNSTDRQCGADGREDGHADGMSDETADEQRAEFAENRSQQSSHYPPRLRSGITARPPAARLPTLSDFVQSLPSSRSSRVTHESRTPTSQHSLKPNVSESRDYPNLVVSGHSKSVKDEYERCALLASVKGEEIICDDRDIFKHSVPPESFILKDSWPLVGRDCEAQMFADVKGEFGVPTLLGSYQVGATVAEADASAPNFMEVLDDAEYWNVFNSAITERDFEPEVRYHMRSLFETEGDHLLSSSGPHDLARAVIHAILGKFLNFSVSGSLNAPTRPLELV
jgi:hypothetical protein